MKKTIVFGISALLILFFFSCKKELLPSAQNSSNLQLRYSEDVLDKNRTVENAMFAIEYQLNNDLVDTTLLDGTTEHEAMKIDTIPYLDFAIKDDEMTVDEQLKVYSDIESSISEIMDDKYPESDGGLMIVDFRITAQTAESVDFEILIGHAKKSSSGCPSCTFTGYRDFLTNGDWNQTTFDCSSLDDKMNLYFSRCYANEGNFGYYYDYMIDFGTWPDIMVQSSNFSPSISFYSSITASNQLLIRDEAEFQIDNYMSNVTDGRNSHIGINIYPDIIVSVGSTRFYSARLIRAKYHPGAIPF